MQKQTQLLRTIGAQAPELMEKLIGLWGRAELRSQVDDLVNGRGPAARTPLTAEIKAALAALREEHDVQFPQFAAEPAPVAVPATLAASGHYQTIAGRFPRIASRLCHLWGTAAFAGEVNGLLNDSRAGARQGFPPEVALALFNLAQDHDREFPQFVLITTDIWSLTLKE
jgi:hypothetical protein